MINQFIDTTGTILNRYTLTHSDNTTEEVRLTFNPSEDYVAGTPFDALHMNPIVNALNITTGTLTAGETSITIQDNKILSTSMLDFYTSIWGVSPRTVTPATGSVTLTFFAQATDMTVGVRVAG